jgi:hypothetical protein
VGWLVCLYDCVMVMYNKQINKQTTNKHGIIARGGRPQRLSFEPGQMRIPSVSTIRTFSGMVRAVLA